MTHHRATTQQIPTSLQARMRGVTWHEEIPSPRLDALRLLEIPFVDFAGTEQLGQLITSIQLAEDAHGIFAALHALRFPIASMRLMLEFQGDDADSMAANNSSCFNSRRIINSDRLSLHAYGAAIDINPIQNPVIRDGKHRPDAGGEYLDRRVRRPGMFYDSSPALQTIRDIGWSWGGDWNNPKDYHHFFLPS